jgi:hypothetical protein
MALHRLFLNDRHHLCVYFETGGLFSDSEDFKKSSSRPFLVNWFRLYRHNVNSKQTVVQ